MKAVVAAFNKKKALVGAFSVITNLRMELFQALHPTAESARLLSFLITLLQQINFSDDEAYVENTLNFTNSSSTVLGISERNVILEDR